MARASRADRAEVARMAKINAKHRTRYISKLTKLRNSTIKHVIRNMSGSVDSLAKNASNLVSEPYLKGFYKDLYENVGGYWARNTYNTVIGAKADINDAIWKRDLDKYIDKNTGKLIKSVEGSLKERVRSTVQIYVDEAVSEGTGLETLTQKAAEHLGEKYTGYKTWKVRQIVSQEVLSSFSVAQDIGAKSAGVPFITIWIHSGAGNPHENHVTLNNTQANSRGLFNVGGFMAQYPRDISLPAGESINCMCTVLYRPVRK